MIQIKPCLIQCDNCHEVIEVFTDIDIISSTERQMGFETEYEGVVDDVCPKCGHSIHLGLSVFEYPENAVNYQDEYVEGAVLLEAPTYDPFS